MKLGFAIPLLGVLLASAACGTDNSASVVPARSAPAEAASSAPAPAAAAPAAGALTVKISDFKIDPGVVTVKTGSAITVKNDGPTPHNLAIKDSTGKTVATTANLKPGESASLSINLPAGTYTQFCSLPGHESLGMKGTLTVS